MKFTAKIKDIGRTLTGSLTLTLESSQMDTTAAMELSKMERLDVEIKKHREKRSNDANRYYWELTSRLAEALHVSKPYIHNCMLRRYGQYETVGGELVCSEIRDTDEARKQVDEAEMYHLKPTSRVIEGKDGVLFRTYIMLKGSSRYDTKEMSHLIDGLISECKEMGIETIPPEEFERMMAAYGKRLKSVLTDDLEHCYVTGSCHVAIHHVFPGIGRRKLCEKYGFIVPLEPSLHNMSSASVHSNPNTGLDLQLKQECQRYFEEHCGPRKKFVEVFGKSYL